MRIAFFSAALLASSVSMAATPIDGWYSSAFGGISYLPDNINTSRFGVTLTDASYQMGYHAGGRFGFQSNPMRYEAEVTYIDANLKNFNINHSHQYHVGGQTNATLGMANVYYDFPEILPAIQSFLGIGLGYAYVDTRLTSRAPFGFTRFKGADSVFAYQATAGLTYNFAENYALNIAYRYVGTSRVDKLDKIFQANLGSVGVVYRFDESSYK